MSWVINQKFVGNAKNDIILPNLGSLMALTAKVYEFFFWLTWRKQSSVYCANERLNFPKFASMRVVVTFKFLKCVLCFHLIVKP